MLPFCGYNMADYLGHWLHMGDLLSEEGRPKIFYVNWFRKGPDGRFLWPGFGDNSRVLEWVFERCAGRAAAVATPIGLVPSPDALPTDGMDLPEADLEALLAVDNREWSEELAGVEEHYRTLGERVPTRLVDQLAALRARLGR
jgi:phosphoenolpyruvate carboxykinase (GTP)